MRLSILLLAALQISCGGIGTNTPSDPAPAVSITVSPSTASVSVNGTIQLSAAIENSNSGVTWQVDSIPGGNATLGTISLTGPSVTYRAPAAIPNPATVTVTAILQSNSGITGSALITVMPAPGPTVSISPPSADVSPGRTVVFVAAVQNSDSGVIWEVNNVAGGNSALGTIVPEPTGGSQASPTALYTAPAKIPIGTITISAVLQVDLVTAASATVVLTESPPPGPAVSISPASPTITPGDSVQFIATVSNSNAAVAWQIKGSGIGTLTPSRSNPLAATYTAPTAAALSGLPVSITVSAVLSDGSASASANVTISNFTGVYSWRNDAGLTGQNQAETILTPANVAPGTFGKLFGCPVDGSVYAQPLYVPNLAIPGQGIHNVVFAATEHDSIFAFDADASPCETLWQVTFINPSAGINTVPSTDLGSVDIIPEIGITGTPVIDPATGTLYVVAKTRENTTSATSYTYVQRLHALDIATGAEKFGGPVVISPSVPGTGVGTDTQGDIAFDPLNDNQRGALQLSGGSVYIPFGSYIYAPGQAPAIHGWLLAYSAATLQLVGVYNATPNSSGGGIGQSGAAPSVDANGNLFIATGDGVPWDANNDFSQTELDLSASLTSPALTDTNAYFTTFRQGQLDAFNQDFGSGGVLLLPDQPGPTPHLSLVGDAAGTLYLLNRDNLGGYTQAPGPDKAVEELSVSANGVFGTPGYFVGNNTIYIAAAGDALKAFSLTNDEIPNAPNSQSTATFGVPNFLGSSPQISSNGPSNPIVWLVDSSGFGGGAPASPAILYAFDGNNLQRQLYSSAAVAGDAAGLAVKYTVPTIANGKVYVGTQGEISVYGLLP